MCFPSNIGEHLSIDETSLSNGELYTIVINKEGHGKKGSLVAMIKGTKSEDVCKWITRKLPIRHTSFYFIGRTAETLTNLL